jgi:hypothetical protein
MGVWYNERQNQAASIAKQWDTHQRDASRMTVGRLASTVDGDFHPLVVRL